MPGFKSSFSNDEDIVFASNADFSGAADHTGANGLTAQGKLWIGDGAALPAGVSVGSITSPGGTVTIGYSDPNITIDVAGGGFNWVNIGASQSLSVSTGYFCSAGGALSLSLPLTSVVGDTIQVVLDGSTSFTITQGAGQRIRLGNVVSTTGAGGSVASTLRGDSIKLVCQADNTFWTATSSVGAFTIT